jgi:hypothetical protein
MISTIAFIAFALFLVVGLYRSRSKGKRYSLDSWEELCTRLRPVDLSGIKTLSDEYLQPSTSRAARTQDEVWALVGGAEGVKTMQQNAVVLLAMASRALQWTPPEQQYIFEQMQRDSIAFERAVIGLALGKTSGYGKARVSLYVQEAANSYCLMRRRLFVLYETCHIKFNPDTGCLDKDLRGDYQSV